MAASLSCVTSKLNCSKLPSYNDDDHDGDRVDDAADDDVADNADDGEARCKLLTFKSKCWWSMVRVDVVMVTMMWMVMMFMMLMLRLTKMRRMPSVTSQLNCSEW